MNRILVTGAGGQIGSWLVPKLRELYGESAVLATDIRTLDPEMTGGGPFQVLDATDPRAVGQAAMRHDADAIFHLAAILSAVGERDPRLAWHVNMGSLEAVLEVARDQSCAVFTPSSIGVFGPDSPKNPAPQDTIMRPRTAYGITKVAGELLCDYYHRRFGVDTRGVRFPGLISYGAPPGGGTTDWAVDIFYKAVEHGAVHVLPGGGHAARHDVHARRRPGGHRRNGGGPRPTRPPQRVQRHGDATHARGA